MANFKKLLGCGPSHALLFYKDGVSSCYFVDEELATFGQDLVAVLRKDMPRLDEWIALTREDIDGVKRMIGADINDNSFSDIQARLHRYGIFYFALKELSNHLPEEMKGNVLPKITEIRKYGETVYFDTSEFIGRALLLITQKTGLSLDLAETLTPEECIDYLSNGTIPDSSTLKNRQSGCVAYFDPEATFLTEEEVGDVKNHLFRDVPTSELRGQSAYPGRVRAACTLITKFTPDTDIVQGTILVTGMTDPRFVPLMKKAGAIITDAGGILCHAAIVSRELHIPCVVGTKFATQVLKTGDVVEVDAEKGIVTII